MLNLLTSSPPFNLFYVTFISSDSDDSAAGRGPADGRDRQNQLRGLRGAGHHVYWDQPRYQLRLDPGPHPGENTHRGQCTK